MVLWAMIGMMTLGHAGPHATDDVALATSGKLLLQVRMGEPTAASEAQLAQMTLADLQAQLPDDRSKKTFWINIYNAYFQILASKGIDKPAIFKEKYIPIAGEKFSLDEIEHGILRRYRWKFSLGYLPQWFPGKLIRRLSVSEVDYRIHFALNCGAKSCPPIAFYEADRLDAQLDLARDGFLQSETEVDESHKVLRVTQLFQWFRADFGGKRGVRTILAQVLGRDLAGWKIEYLPYDWSAQLHHFVGE